MFFTKEYFQKEMREGFEVSEMMKRCWAAQLEVLEQFDAICKAHSIRYFLAYGSLLGAVRHKGFIPWDDDIDVWMMRDDLDRLTKETKTELSKEGIELVTPFTDDNYGNLVFRLINTRDYCLNEDFLKRYWLFPFMAGLDIFVLDYVPRDEQKYNDQRTLLASTWLLAHHWNDSSISEDEKLETYNQLMSILGTESVEKKLISQQLWKLADRIGGLYGDADSDMMTIWGYYLKDQKKIFRKEWFEETAYLEFEGRVWPCPVGYEDVLKIEFGEDYMTPVMWTGDHEYPYYKDAHLRLMSTFEKMGISCPEIYRNL